LPEGRFNGLLTGYERISWDSIRGYGWKIFIDGIYLTEPSKHSDYNGDMIWIDVDLYKEKMRIFH